MTRTGVSVFAFALGGTRMDELWKHITGRSIETFLLISAQTHLSQWRQLIFSITSTRRRLTAILNGIGRLIFVWTKRDFPTLAREVRVRILVDAIPAESFAAGANALLVWGESRNYNYNAFMANVESWPRFNRENGVKKLLWHHSDIKNIAYYFVYPLFELLVSEGD